MFAYIPSTLKHDNSLVKYGSSTISLPPTGGAAFTDSLQQIVHVHLGSSFLCETRFLKDGLDLGLEIEIVFDDLESVSDGAEYQNRRLSHAA